MHSPYSMQQRADRRAIVSVIIKRMSVFSIKYHEYCAKLFVGLGEKGADPLQTQVE